MDFRRIAYRDVTTRNHADIAACFAMLGIAYEFGRAFATVAEFSADTARDYCSYFGLLSTLNKTLDITCPLAQCGG